MAAMCCWHQLRCGRLHNLGLLFVQGEMATPAQIVRGSKLDEQAAVATYNLPGINRG
jgi:hypothetical protein